MKKIYLTPGPSQLYPTVAKYLESAMQEDICSLSHRSKAFEEMFLQITEKLRELMSIPKTYSIFLLGSGTEGMERTIENCVEKKSFHFVNGAFSKRFHEIARELKKQPEKIEAADGQGFTEVSIPKQIEVICFTHNETSTGAMLPKGFIERFKTSYVDKLVAVDIVSSAPVSEIDYNYIDIAFFSVQKGFGLPAGLGVMIVSPQGMEKAVYLSKKNSNIGSYHNFLTLQQYSQKHQTPETPPILHMYLLNNVLTDMLAIGIDTIRRQTKEKAALLYDFLDSHQNIYPFVQDKNIRSQTVITGQTNEQTKRVLQELEKQNLVVGEGYGIYKTSQLRIANMPAHKMEDIKRLIDKLRLLV